MVQPFDITKSNCIAINNVESAKKEMDKFARQLEDEMDRFESSRMVLGRSVFPANFPDLNFEEE